MLKRRKRSASSDRITEPWKDREPGDPKVNLRVEFAKFRNYLDLLRGLAGSVVIWGGREIAPAIAAELGAPKSVIYQVLGLRCAILLIGLLIQAVRIEKQRVSFYPPIFFLSGLSIGLCGYKAAAFAFVLIWSINAAVSNAQAFLTLYAVLQVAFAYFLSKNGIVQMGLAGLLTFLPVLLSLMASRPLMIFTRRGSRSPKPA